MAQEKQNTRKPVRPPGYREPSRDPKDQKRYGTSFYHARCTEIYPSDAEDEVMGWVYLMKDAAGQTKVGYSADPGCRHFIVKYSAPMARRPVVIAKAFPLFGNKLPISGKPCPMFSLAMKEPP